MDTVSEVKEIKHAFKAGIKARQGADSFTLLIREWQPLPSQP